MLGRSIDDSQINTVYPKTFEEYQKWDKDADELPPEEVFKAIYFELGEGDKIQIGRWRAFGPRHIGGIKKNCPKRKFSCRKKQRQALLQWAYNPFF